jgi:hypothetical protein
MHATVWPDRIDILTVGAVAKKFGNPDRVREHREEPRPSFDVASQHLQINTSILQTQSPLTFFHSFKRLVR